MNYNKQILAWLIISAVMVIIMVFVGGLTRLSDAGLSIVEWNPVTGIFPPMNRLNLSIVIVILNSVILSRYFGSNSFIEFLEE